MEENRPNIHSEVHKDTESIIEVSSNFTINYSHH